MAERQCVCDQYEGTFLDDKGNVCHRYECDAYNDGFEAGAKSGRKEVVDIIDNYLKKAMSENYVWEKIDLDWWQEQKKEWCVKDAK